MIAKFIILAFVAVALAQDDVQRPEPDYEIKRAILRLRGLSTSAERGVNGALKEVDIKRVGVQLKATTFLEKEVDMEEQLQRVVGRVAEEMERRADELNKPPSTFECITRAEKLTISRLEMLEPKFEVDIRRLERTKLDSIDVTARPLPELKDGLQARYEKFETELKNCRDSVCVRKTLARARREYDLLYAELKRINFQAQTAYNQFVRDASNQFRNLARTANRIATEGIRSIKLCVFSRTVEDVFQIKSELSELREFSEESEETEEY